MADFSPSLRDFYRKIKLEDIRKIISECVKNLWASKFDASDEKKIEHYTECILDIVRNKDFEKLIYEYSFKDLATHSFDFAILKTIINHKLKCGVENRIKLIEMTIDWNRHDVAKKELLDERIDWRVNNKKQNSVLVI